MHRLARPPVRARLFRFPYVAVGSLAAACFAVLLVLLNQQQSTHRTPLPIAKSITEKPVTLAPPAGDDDESRKLGLADATSEPGGPILPVTPTPAASTDAAGASASAPVVAANDAATAGTPTAVPPAPAVPVSPIPELAAVTPTPLPENPNPTALPMRQTSGTAPRAAAAWSPDGRRKTTRTASEREAPAATPLADAGFGATRDAVVEGALPPAPPPGAATPGDGNAGRYRELLADNSVTPDQLRLTFREFGEAPRYPGNTGSGAPARGDSPLLAANTDAAKRDREAPTDENRRAREENIKTTVAPRPRITLEQPADFGDLRSEADARGPLDRGATIADLETQLRELRRADASLDSPVQDFVRDNAFVPVAESPTSEFPVVVDNASPVAVRRALLAGKRPGREAVRIDELLNQARYNYPAPAADAAEPFRADLEVASAPWAPEHRLVRIGLKARELPPAGRPPASYVLLIETGAPDARDSHLQAIKQALHNFVARLGPQDQVTIASHSSAASLVLATTPARERDVILRTVDRVQATGPATGLTGLQLAYDLARAHFIHGGINRVILASDGDTRIDDANRDHAARLIDGQARSGILLSALGFGVRDIPDSMLEQLAHRGSGEFAFVDSPQDAQLALADRAGGGFATVARNVKLQVEFNPAQVQAWRLIGYEDRVFLREDFDPESLAADAVGAGHALTALFEIVPAGPPAPAPDNNGARSTELLTVKIRSTPPDDDTPRLQQFSVVDHGAAFAAASPDFKFATAVAGFGMLLRESPYRGTTTVGDVAAWARAGRGADDDGARAEFIDLVDRARTVLR